ncbi:isocitrate lyase/phosphoenolpyruvate mutase family protein [soil metagenome]
MNNQIKQAQVFKSLHINGGPLILFNIWDAGSAKAIQAIGAKAIATSSWSVAASHGYEDGEKLSFHLVLSNLERIIKSVDLPVTIDLEGGYGKNVVEIQETVTSIIKAGAVGINIEDQMIGNEALYSIEEQCARIKAIHQIAAQISMPLFINARTDIFLKTAPVNHHDNHLKEAIHRAISYAEAGANGFFAPGLAHIPYIEKLCTVSPIPVNIMISSNAFPSKQLAKLGVARISYGPDPYRLVMKALQEAGHRAFSRNVE